MPRKDDWRPKLSRMEDPIAEDHWEYVTPKGQQRVSKLAVGRPVHFPEERLWYCPVLIEGYTRPRIKPIFGSGPVDSLMNAMTFVRTFFEENSEVLPGAKPRRTRGTRSTQRGKKSAERAQPRKTSRKRRPPSR